MQSLLGTAWLGHALALHLLLEGLRCVKSVIPQPFWYQYPGISNAGFGAIRHRLYIHLVWTTRARARLIDATLARFLCRFLRAMARKERAYILEISMVQTHVHILARAHPTIPVSALIKRLKGASSAVAAQEGLGRLGRLYWAKGYSVQSVSARGLDAVRAYLRGQPIHHPDEAIVHWEGDTPEYDEAGGRW